MSVVVRHLWNEHPWFTSNGGALGQSQDMSAGPLLHSHISKRAFIPKATIHRRQTRITSFPNRRDIVGNPATSWSNDEKAFPRESTNSHVRKREVYLVRLAAAHVLAHLEQLLGQPRPLALTPAGVAL